MTANELKEVLSKTDFNSFTDEELKSVLDTMSTKLTEVKCIIIRRKHTKIRNPLPQDKKVN